jgi:hypothetical protein
MQTKEPVSKPRLGLKPVLCIATKKGLFETMFQTAPFSATQTVRPFFAARPPGF